MNTHRQLKCSSSSNTTYSELHALYKDISIYIFFHKNIGYMNLLSPNLITKAKYYENVNYQDHALIS